MRPSMSASCLLVKQNRSAYGERLDPVNLFYIDKYYLLSNANDVCLLGP